MQTIAAKVKVNADRTITVQLPADVDIGEYDAVLVLNNRAEATSSIAKNDPNLEFQRPRIPGQDRGKVFISPDFDEPLPSDILDGFLNPQDPQP